MLENKHIKEIINCTLNSEEIEVWEKEKIYFLFLIEKKFDKFLNLWDKSFIGWPYSFDIPCDFNKIKTLKDSLIFKNPIHITLNCLRIKIVKNTALTYYFCTIKDCKNSLENNAEIFRMTHTWIRIDGNWKIIGGMSNKEKETR